VHLWSAPTPPSGPPFASPIVPRIWSRRIIDTCLLHAHARGAQQSCRRYLAPESHTGARSGQPSRRPAAMSVLVGQRHVYGNGRTTTWEDVRPAPARVAGTGGNPQGVAPFEGCEPSTTAQFAAAFAESRRAGGRPSDVVAERPGAAPSGKLLGTRRHRAVVVDEQCAAAEIHEPPTRPVGSAPTPFNHWKLRPLPLGAVVPKVPSFASWAFLVATGRRPCSLASPRHARQTAATFDHRCHADVPSPAGAGPGAGRPR